MANKQLPPANAACAICTRRQVELHKQTNDKPKPCPADSAPTVQYLVCVMYNALCLSESNDFYRIFVAEPMSKAGYIDNTNCFGILSKLIYSIFSKYYFWDNVVFYLFLFCTKCKTYIFNIKQLLNKFDR